MREYKCNKCRNKRVIFDVKEKKWKRCPCVMKIQADRIMSKSGFPESLWYSELKKCTDHQKDILNLILFDEEAKKTKKIKKSFRSLFMYSMTPEKDFLIAVLCRCLTVKVPSVKSILYLTLDQLAQRQFGKYVQGVTSESLVDTDVVVISIGREITNAAHKSALYSMLYDRILANKLTFVSSFIPRNRIIQVYQKAVDSLLAEYFDFYSLEGII